MVQSTGLRAIVCLLLSGFLAIFATAVDLQALGDGFDNLTPVQAWEERRQCHPAYFRPTRDNMNNSRVDEWYQNFINEEALKQPALFIGRGEVAFFGEVGWNDFNFQCSIYFQGCKRLPKCEQVVKFVEGDNSNTTTLEILDLSRKIFFAAQQIHSIANDYTYAHVRNKPTSTVLQPC